MFRATIFDYHQYEDDTAVNQAFTLTMHFAQLMKFAQQNAVPALENAAFNLANGLLDAIRLHFMPLITSLFEKDGTLACDILSNIQKGCRALHILCGELKGSKKRSHAKSPAIKKSIELLLLEVRRSLESEEKGQAFWIGKNTLHETKG